MRSRTGFYAIVVVALLLVASSAFGTTISVPGDYATIQAAVDAAAPTDVVAVAAGTYTEQVHIQTANITLSGAGVGVTIIKSPAALVDHYTTSYDHYPVVFIDGVAGVTLSDLTVDGDRKGNANYKFEGVSFWNSDGALTDVEVLRVMDDPFSGAQHGVGIYSYNSGGGPYSIALTDVLVDDYQKTGVALLGDQLTVDLTRVVTRGQGATDVTAQNGIQTGYGSGGTLTDCEVYDNWYTGGSVTASGFLPQIGAAVDVTGAILDGNQTSVYTYDVDCAMADCEVTGCGGSAVIAFASGAKAGSENAPLLPSPIAEDYSVKGTRAPMSFAADGCTLTGTDVVDEAGIYPYGAGDVLGVTITDSDLSHWDYAVFAYEDGGTISLTLHGNSFHDNGSYAAYAATAADQDFEENWWDDAAGPSQDAKAGGAVNDKVDYSPWNAAPPGTDPMPIGTDDSIQDAINAASPGATITVLAGTYAERLNIGKEIALRGAQYGVDPTAAGARTDPSAESIVTEAGLSTPNPDVLIEVSSGGEGTSINGFTLHGDPTNLTADTSTIRAWCDDLDVSYNIIDGLYGVLHKGGSGVTVDHNSIDANKVGITCQPGTYSGFALTNNTVGLGSSPVGGESGIYMTSTSHFTVSGNDVSGFVNGNAIGGSSNTSVDIIGNSFDGCVKGVNFWGNTTFVDIEDNDITGCSTAGVNIKGQDILISGNVFDGCTVGASIDKHTLVTERVTVTDNDFSDCVTQGLSVTAAVLETVDASANWWGAVDPSTVRASANAGIGADYTPWLAGGEGGDPGFAGDYSTLYVDDDSEQTGSATRIQESINLAVGSTVYVMDGVYGADPATGAGAYITDDGMNLIGESEAGTIIDGSVDGVGVSGTYWPRGIHVQAHGVTVRNFTVSGFTGDMENTGGYGVLFRDYDHDTTTEGYIFYDGCTVEDVSTSACYEGIYALCFTHLTVEGCTVEDSYADGMFIARGSDYASVTDNVVTNSLNQGIWVGYSWTATTPSNHAVITGNHIDGAMEGGISFVGSSDALIEGNYITNVAGDGWSVGGLSIKDGCSNVTARYNTITGNDGSWGGFSGLGHGIGIDGAASNISLNWNSVYGNAGDGCHNYSSADVDATHTWWGDGSGPGGVGPGTGDEVTTHVLYDPWIGKPLEGGNIVCVPDLLDITEGMAHGDVAVEYLGGGGGMLYSYSMTVTWDAAVVSLVSITEGDLLKSYGSTQMYVYGSGNTRTIDCTLLSSVPGVTGPGTMFTLRFAPVGYGESDVALGLVAFRDNINTHLAGFYGDDGLIRVDTADPVVTDAHIENLTLLHTNDYVKNHDYLELTATVTDDYALTKDDILADFSTLLVGVVDGVPAEDYSGDVATWTIALEDVDLTADGVKTVTITVTDGLGNVGTGSDDIEVDNTAPGKVTGFAAAPAHEEVVLSWDNASGAPTEYYGVMVRYNVWGDYPTYDLDEPDYPATETAGLEAFSGDAPTGTTHAIIPQDIHYYSAFVYDTALNFSVVDGDGQDRATNYWLGDVANVLNAWEPDGYVSDPDIAKLSGTYGGAPSGDFLKCDVGPTDDYSRVGIPYPDNFVNFEDLMMFAMNYDVVSPKIVPFLDGTPDGSLMLALHELRSEDGVFDVAVRLEGNAGEVKGLSAVVSYDPSVLEFVSAAATEDMYSPLAPVFFWSSAGEGKVQVDLAVLGTGMTIGGSGDVAVLTFRTLGGECALGYESALLRGAENEDLTAELEGLESKPEMPSVFRLVQNSPNPFNPVTTVAYHVPNDATVSLRVYDVAGRLVRTLVDGVEEPGVHAVVWDGRSDRGESVGSGVYFCVMEAPGFRDSRKMTLLK